MFEVWYLAQNLEEVEPLVTQVATDETAEQEDGDQGPSAACAPVTRWGGRLRVKMRLYFRGVFLPGWKLSESRSGVLLILRPPELSSVAKRELTWFSGFGAWFFRGHVKEPEGSVFPLLISFRNL